MSAVSRFGLGIVWVYSGIMKLRDPLNAKQSVQAYELFSLSISNFIGTFLPAVELILGVLLIVGLFLRVVGAVSLLLLVLFVIGIFSAWARGLTIDCGCFGTGGYDSSITGWSYASEIIRDAVFIVFGAICCWKPFKRYALYA